MPGLVLHVGLTAMCPHGGVIQVVPSGQPRVMVGGQPAASMTSNCSVVGCAFTVPPGKPQPCVKIQWVVPATRVFIGGSPALLATSTGLGQSAEQIPQGPPSVTVTQPQVQGT